MTQNSKFTVIITKSVSLCQAFMAFAHPSESKKKTYQLLSSCPAVHIIPASKPDGIFSARLSLKTGNDIAVATRFTHRTNTSMRISQCCITLSVYLFSDCGFRSLRRFATQWVTPFCCETCFNSSAAS